MSQVPVWWSFLWDWAGAGVRGICGHAVLCKESGPRDAIQVLLELQGRARGKVRSWVQPG